jgi:hypothetical protein
VASVTLVASQSRMGSPVPLPHLCAFLARNGAAFTFRTSTNYMYYVSNTRPPNWTRHIRSNDFRHLCCIWLLIMDWVSAATTALAHPPTEPAEASITSSTWIFNNDGLTRMGKHSKVFSEIWTCRHNTALARIYKIFYTKMWCAQSILYRQCTVTAFVNP